MQFVNDDMDDELFRHAAEEYPLKTDSGDWNKVFNKMQAGTNNGSQKKDNKNKYLFLLALIPLFLICTTYIKNDSSNSVGRIEKSTIKDVLAPQNEKKAVVPPDEIALKLEKPDNRLIATNKQQIDFFASNNATHKTNNGFAVKKKGDEVSALSKGATAHIESDISDVKNGNKSINSTNVTTSNQDLITVGPGKIQNSSTVNGDKTEVPEAQKETPASVFVKDKKEKKNKKPANKFYFGFQAGPDFSMVKSTNINGAGYSVGLLAGYNFSKKLSL